MTDVVFYLKSGPTNADRALPWPSKTKLIAIDPPANCMCGGSDPRCSNAYSCLWQSLGGSAGVIPNLLKRYAAGISVERIAFVGFSAAHGFLNPLLNNDSDRSRVDAVILMDATFGGGKSGYLKASLDAVRGQKLLVSTTSNTGGDEGWRMVWQKVISSSGASPTKVVARPPVPEPSGGVFQIGSLYYLRYVKQSGGTELPHWKMGKIQSAILSAYLIPYWRGELVSSTRGISISSALFILGALAAGWWLFRR